MLNYRFVDDETLRVKIIVICISLKQKQKRLKTLLKIQCVKNKVFNFH